MIKNYSLVFILFSCFVWSGFGQVTTIDFEVAGDGYNSSSTIGSGWEDVFNRTNFDMSIVNNEDGYYWAAEDFDGTRFLDLNQIDISGGSLFIFSLDWLSKNYNDWDGNTEFSITYSIDGGPYQNLIWVRNICGCTNAPAAVDLAFDGIGDCGRLTTLPSRITGMADGCTVNSTRNQFETYDADSIALSGNSTLDIKISYSGFTQNDIGIYIDNIEIDLIGGTPTPELQLVDNTSTIQNCGYTIDFGDVASDGSFSDLTFDIENIGTADLDVSSLGITGDYSIVSPTAPFIVAASASQTVTVRFSPASDGLLTGQLTINNDDSNEGTCLVNLTGNGFTPGPNMTVYPVTAAPNPAPIPNDASTPYDYLGFNNTLFAARTINAGSQTKTYRIRNESDAQLPLDISDISLSGDTADFFVTPSPVIPFSLSPGAFQDFTITFQPMSDSGFRSVTVSISNSDPDKNPYLYRVGGQANCPSVSGSITPNSGPSLTTIVVKSPGNDLTGATAELNGEPLDFVSGDSEELVVKLTTAITQSGILNVTLSNDCVFSNSFTLLDETISGCDTSSSAIVDDLFISQVTDSPFGALSYVELYNATGADIDFAVSNYSIKIYNNANTGTANGTLVLNSGTINQNSTYVIAIGTSDDNFCNGGTNGADGSYTSNGDVINSTSINFNRSGSNNQGHDFIGLYSVAAVDTATNPQGQIDSWGIFGDQTWASLLSLGGSGVNFERDIDNAVSFPNTNFSNSDWIITNWNDCSPDVDYSGIGDFDFSFGVPP